MPRHEKHLLGGLVLPAGGQVKDQPGSRGQDIPAYRENSVELFFNRDKRRSPYHQLIINAAGGVFDMRANDMAWTLRGLNTASACTPTGGNWRWLCRLPRSDCVCQGIG